MQINKHGSFFRIPNKFWELEIMNYKTSWFKFFFDLSRECDHAGLQILIEIVHFSIELRIYDNRHWDYENDRFL